jgi:putative transposase
MILTKKIKITPVGIVLEILWSISYLCKNVWNAALEQRKDKKSWGKVNVYTQKKELPPLKEEFPEYKKPASQVLQNVLYALDRAYKQFFTKKNKGDRDAKPPKFKSFKQFFTQEYSQYGTSFVVEGKLLKLAYGSCKKDWLEIKLPCALEFVPKTVELKKEGKEFYACFTFEVKEEEEKKTGCKLPTDKSSGL